MTQTATRSVERSVSGQRGVTRMAEVTIKAIRQEEGSANACIDMQSSSSRAESWQRSTTEALDASRASAAWTLLKEMSMAVMTAAEYQLPTLCAVAGSSTRWQMTRKQSDATSPALHALRMREEAPIAVCGAVATIPRVAEPMKR